MKQEGESAVTQLGEAPPNPDLGHMRGVANGEVKTRQELVNKERTFKKSDHRRPRLSKTL